MHAPQVQAAPSGKVRARAGQPRLDGSHTSLCRCMDTSAVVSPGHGTRLSNEEQHAADLCLTDRPSTEA